MPIRPVQPSRPIAKPAAAAKAQGSPQALIDRRHVAGALDRPGPGLKADGVISREELEAAGIARVDAEALAVINEPGEALEQITVNELARALAADRVAITSQGAIAIERKRARLVEGAIQPATPWQFPEVADLRILAEFDRLVPRLGRYHPDWPDGRYVDRVHDGYERVKVGTRRVYDGTDADGNPKYRQEDVYEDRPKYRDEIQYDRLYHDLHRKAEQVLAMSAGAQDPALVQAREALQAAYDKGAGWWAHESAVRRHYRALKAFDAIQAPARPESVAGGLHQSLQATAGAIEEQARITREVPVERARAVIGKEAARLRAPSASNYVSAGLAAAGAGAAGFFGLAGLLAGLPLIGAAVGVGAVAGGLGWLVAQWVKNGEARELEGHLKVLATIDPEENREEMEQHALAAYRLLQDARTADSLAGMRQFEAEAKRFGTALAAIKTRAEAESRSLKTVEKWVQRG